MAQISNKLRRVDGGYAHWCPGCNEIHILPDGGWGFNGDLERPTFTPSFKHMGGTAGERGVCHYILTNGVLNYCGDSTHSLRGPVPLPDLPEALRDKEWLSK